MDKAVLGFCDEEFSRCQHQWPSALPRNDDPDSEARQDPGSGESF
ncbi:hypothetical protein EDC90_103735 [Martelella mediterranea]|uniref:Uncharacterized protein n=1 Tax=Martelella mediterranea TaxID=293089 RepID=A0A4R3NHP1_9HYPH|nr:hypothetical protein EDC90_103735 [Martelella mediterranea]